MEQIAKRNIKVGDYLKAIYIGKKNELEFDVTYFRVSKTDIDYDEEKVRIWATKWADFKNGKFIGIINLINCEINLQKDIIFFKLNETEFLDIAGKELMLDTLS
jgi:hypothetical protein